ncbi:MAG TPA: TolC family protein [Verrucomicrobiae bacterium]|nr:TolC family protein [Verrucomicrobiae bacterium]
MRLSRITNKGLVVAFTCLVGVATVLYAEPQEITSSLALDAVVADALQSNPQIHAMRARWEAAREKPVQERTLPNPEFIYMGMDSTSGYSFPNTPEKRLELDQPFPWFGKLGLRSRVAEQDALAMQREYEATQREVLMQVKESYFDLYAVQRTISITRAETDVVRQIEQIAETKYATGTATQGDVLKAQAEITVLKQRLLELAQQETTLKARLNQLLDRPADSSLGLAVTEPAMEFKASAPELFALAEKRRPEIQGAAAGVQRSQLERQLMKKEFFPDYRLGVQYRDIGGGDDMVMFIVGFGLPIWQTKYRAGVREAEKMIESNRAALEAVKKQTSFDVQDSHFKLLTAQRTVDLYKGSLIPQAEARFSASEAGYRTGTVDFLDLLESERFLLDARVMEATAEGDVGMQLARLERAVGTDLTKVEEKK